MTARPTAVVREGWASILSQPVASILTVLMVVGMILTVMLTTGRSVGAEQRVLSSFDDVGTRTVQVRAEAEAGLTSDVLDRLSNIEGIEWAAAFSGAVDATNSAIPDGTRVPVRLAYGTHLGRLGIPTTSPLPDKVAYLSRDALDRLGLPDVTGSITTTGGVDYAVAGELTTPDSLADLEPIALVPQSQLGGDEPVNMLIVIAQRPDLVTPVSTAVLSVLAVDDPTTVTVQTSEALAQLRAIVQTQLGTFSRGLVLVTLAVTAVLVALVLYALVVMRRKDFGRRRALGATRRLIIVLLLTQTTILALAGVAIGVTSSVIALTVTRDPLPDLAFTAALSILTLATAGLAALIPAAVASTREPIRELRVP